jgi:hypothetical protein
MNKNILCVALGSFLTVMAQVTLESSKPIPPAPPKCEASKEAQATISALTDVLKKSVDGLAQSCGK